MTTAQRLLSALPDYYQDNDLLGRVANAVGAELDRLEAEAEATRDALIPTSASGKALSAWGAILAVPNSGVTDPSLRDTVIAAIRAMSSTSALETHDALEHAAGGGAVNVFRNTPANLTDTIQVPYGPGTYQATVIERLARRVWPAHRAIVMAYNVGFVIDQSTLDSSDGLG